MADLERGRDEVVRFSVAMLNELQVNAHKGDWRDVDHGTAAHEVLYHGVKLALALGAMRRVRDAGERAVVRQAVLEYAADCGNCAMMAAHAVGALDLAYLTQDHAEFRRGATWRWRLPWWKRVTRRIAHKLTRVPSRAPFTEDNR